MIIKISMGRSLALLITLTSSLAFAKAPKTTPIPVDLGRRVVAHYADIVYATYSDALRDAQTLDAAIHALVKKPSDATLESAREAWKRARVSYSATEAFRFYGGPIDDAEKGPEGFLNAWPMDEAYVDYVEGQKDAGIINRPKEYPKITKKLLLSLNEKDGEKNIATGYHAIEFLLWGQDISAAGPGERPVSDFIKGKGPHAERRSQYLTLLSELLLEHLSQVREAWTPGKKGSYAELLKKEPLEESLRKIYTGVITLSLDEMAGERLTVALEMNDQENEQSCFSDTTLADAKSNQEGIRAVYFGTYGTLKGPGLHDLALAVDAKQAAQSQARVEAATEKASELADTALDKILMTASPKDKGRLAIQALISAFEEQARAIAAPGLKMGLVLNVQ